MTTAPKRPRAPRVTDRIANGLDFIYSFMDCEYTCRQCSSIECHCDGCRGIEQDDGTYDTSHCYCDDKPHGERCEACRLYADLELSLAWLGRMIDRHERR